MPRRQKRHGEESVEETRALHIRALRFLRQRAAQALRGFPPAEVRAALRKLDRPALEDVLLALHEEPDPNLGESLRRECEPWLVARHEAPGGVDA